MRQKKNWQKEKEEIMCFALIQIKIRVRKFKQILKKWEHQFTLILLDLEVSKH